MENRLPIRVVFRYSHYITGTSPSLSRHLKGLPFGNWGSPNFTSPSWTHCTKAVHFQTLENVNESYSRQHKATRFQELRVFDVFFVFLFLAGVCLFLLVG
jgi:hypothetical protein